VFLSTIGFINPNAAALCLAPFTRNAGSASALMGALQMGIGASISALVGVFDVRSAVPMTAIMAGSALLALLVLLLGRKKVRTDELQQSGPAEFTISSIL
jgi:DHA1 family bicyclomycin/chloramphenicol resistance-like MFS transporter